MKEINKRVDLLSPQLTNYHFYLIVLVLESSTILSKERGSQTLLKIILEHLWKQDDITLNRNHGVFV